MRIRTRLTYFNGWKADSLPSTGACFRLRCPQKPISIVSAIQISIPALPAESLLSQSSYFSPPDFTQSTADGLNLTIVVGLYRQHLPARLSSVSAGSHRASRLHQCLQLDSKLAGAGDLALVLYSTSSVNLPTHRYVHRLSLFPYIAPSKHGTSTDCRSSVVSWHVPKKHMISRICMEYAPAGLGGLLCIYSHQMVW